MTFSAFDHPVLSALVGDDELAVFFGARAELSAMLAFEAALAEAEALEGVIAPQAAGAIAAVCEDFEPDLDALRAGVARDGVVVPALVRQLRVAVGADHAGAVHFGATSQDVVDTALIMRCRSALQVLRQRLGALLADLEALDGRFADAPLMARTRMQVALPITAGVRIANWAEPLERLEEDLGAVERRALRLQFAGAAGTLDRLGAAGPAVRRRLAMLLDLADPDGSWHSQRDGIAALAGWLSTLTGALGKIGQDIALMAQNERGEIALAASGRSSAMPHKHNPVAAEVLVALARFNATQLGGLHQALVHEQERAGAAWTLEWLVLPAMFAATGAALQRAAALIGSIERLGEPPAAGDAGAV